MNQKMMSGLDRFERTDLGDLVRGIFETARCVVVFLDLKGKVTYLNPFAEKTFGWSAKEVVGKDWISGFIPKEERTRLRQELKELEKGKSTRSGENSVICKDGSLRRLVWSDNLIHSQTGELAGIVGIGIDVTQEFLVRKKFEEQQTLIRAAMDNMVDGFITIDEGGVIESFNRAAERMFGYSAEEVLGQNVTILMREPDRCHHDEYIQDYLQTGEPKVIGIGREIVARRKGGETFHVSLAVGEMRFGERRLFVGNIRDLSKERALQSAVESEQRLKASIVEASTDAISGLDIQGRVLSWNRGAEKMLGYRAEEVLGKHFKLLIPADLLEDGELERLEAMFQEKGAIRDYVTRRRHKDGREFLVVLSRSALRDEAGGLIGYSSILRDVTEEIWLREKLQQTEKLSAIGELAAGLAHEIGGPLSVISGNAEFLLESLDVNDPGREDVESIARECDAVAVLIRRLLDFSRPAKLETRPVDVNDTLRNVLLLVRKHIVKENIDIKLDLQVGLPPILGDSNQLEQVVMNLVLNARNAMPEGGRLEIRSFRADGSDGNNRGKVAIEIEDSGIGIPKESLGRIFEPFFTTRNRGEGTGLGLAISHRIVTDHQGEISVRSKVGVGTTFTIELPSINEEAG